jgi:hypothetical protein
LILHAKELVVRLEEIRDKIVEARVMIKKLQLDFSNWEVISDLEGKSLLKFLKSASQQLGFFLSHIYSTFTDTDLDDERLRGDSFTPDSCIGDYVESKMDEHKKKAK